MPPIVLEIIVDDSKGTPQIRVFDKAITDTTKTVQQGGQATAQASQSTQAYGSSLGASAKSALTFAGALTGVQLGISAISSAVQGAVTQVVSFEAAMANVNTLGVRSAEVQQQLRTQLLQLPPALGSATELAQGLYEVLSSGVAPANAVAFLGEAAKLAKAGLASLDTSIVSLTKTMAAYNIPTEKAGEVSDLFFKTVEVGQGSLQQFASAMPQVTQLAASMGISLKDTSNAMATLSQTFRSADTAATGLRSLLTQVIQNNDKFLALGINIKQVIGDEGLLGLVRVLQQVSQGDTGTLRQYVNDIEGLNAAVALTGPQFQTLIKNQKEFENAAGAVDRAVKVQTQTVSASFSAMVNALGQLANDIAPPFLHAFTRVAQGATQVIEGTRQTFKDLPKITREALDGMQQEVDKFRAATRGKPLFAFTQEDVGMAALKEFFRALAQGADSLSMTSSAFRVYRDQQVLATDATKGWRDETERSTAALAAQTAGLAQNSAERRQAEHATKGWRDESERSAASLALLKKPIDDANSAMQGFNKGLEELRSGGARSAQDLDTRFAALAKNLDTMATSGALSASEVRSAYEKMADAIRDQFGKLPPVLQAAYDKFVAGARGSADSIDASFKKLGIQSRATLQKLATDALANFQEIEKAGTASPRELLDAWLAVVDQIDKGAFKKLPEGLDASSRKMVDIAKKLGVDLPKPIINAFGDIEFASTKAAQAIDTSWLQTRGALERAKGAIDDLALSTVGLSEKQLQLGYAIKANGDIVNAYGNAIAQLTEETERLNNLQIDIKTPFGTTIDALQEQLRQANRDLLDLPNRINDLGFAGFQQQQKVLQDLIKELEKRIAELQKAQKTSATGTTTTGTTGTTTTGTTGTTATGTTGTTTTGTTGTRPTSSLVVGGGSGGGQPPGFTQIGTTVTTTDMQAQRGVTVNVSLNAQMLTADRATLQSAVDQLAPAINEAIRRGTIH